MWVDYHERLILCLERDWLKGKLFEHPLMMWGVAADCEEGDGGSTNPRRLESADRSLRSCAENAVLISAMVFGEKTHQRLVQCFLCGLSVLRKWTRRALQDLRSVDANERWIVDEAAGRTTAHICEIVAQLQSSEALEKVGFLEAAEKLTKEDFGDQTTLTLAFTRIARMLWLTNGWPGKMMAALKGEEQHSRKVHEFRLEFWNEFKAFDRPMAAHKRLLRRSIFQTHSVEQMRLGVEDDSPDAKQAFLNMLGRRAKTVVPSKPVEAMFGYMKSTKAVKCTTLYRCPETSMFSVLKAGVCGREGLHKYREPVADAPCKRKCDRLSKEAFRPSKRSWSMAFRRLPAPQFL